MPHSSSVAHNCCPMIEAGPARTDPPPPELPCPLCLPAREGVWGGRELKLSRTARPKQAGLETFNPHSGEEGRPYRVPPPPLTHFAITTLVVSTVTLQGQPPLRSAEGGPQPPFSGSHRAAMATAQPPRSGHCGSRSLSSAAQRAPTQNGNFREEWAQEKQQPSGLREDPWGLQEKGG